MFVFSLTCTVFNFLSFIRHLGFINGKQIEKIIFKYCSQRNERMNRLKHLNTSVYTILFE